MMTDLDVIVKKCLAFKNQVPSVKLYYAVKAFSSKEIIETIRQYVDGFDVASMTEINNLISFGVDPQQLNFSNPVKSVESIQQAFKLGITRFTFQSLSELHKVKEHAPGSSVYARVKMNDSQSLVPLSEKFGCLQTEAVELLKSANEIGLKPAGVAFHIGSQLLDSSIWMEAIKSANEIIDNARAAGLDTYHVNIGGGFPARYFESDATIATAAEYINKALRPDSSIEYIAEPGRYIVAESSVIVSKVIGVEVRNGKNWLFIDAGLFQAFLGASRYDQFPYDPIMLTPKKSNKSNRKTSSYILTGPTCDSHDIVAQDVELLSNIEVGDLLAFPNTGAYTLVYGSNFNGFPIPKQYYIKKNKLI